MSTARQYPDSVGHFEPGQTPASTGVFPLTLCLTIDRLLAMLSVLYEGGAALGYGYLGDHNRDLVNALAWLSTNDAPCSKTAQIAPEGEKEAIKHVVLMFLEQHPEILEELMPERYEKKNGVWYVVLPCGDCGGWEYVPLGAASSTDANGNPTPVSANAPALSGYEISIPEVTGDALANCYPERATNYLLERFRQFLNAAAGTVAQALDARFVMADEVIDYVRILLPDVDQSNVIDEIRTQGEEAIFNAVLGYQDALKTNWTYSHNVTKDSLKKWVRDSTPLVSIAQQAMLMWIDASLLYGISKDLRLIAADCQAGTNLLEGATQSGIVPFETSVDGVGPFYVYKFNVIGSTYVTTELMDYPTGKRLLAIGLYHDGHEGNGLGTYAVQFPAGTFWQFRALTPAAGNRLTIYSDAIYADIWAEFEASAPSYGAVGSPPYGLADPAEGDMLVWNNNGLAENWLTAPRLYMIFDDAP